MSKRIGNYGRIRHKNLWRVKWKGEEVEFKTAQQVADYIGVNRKAIYNYTNKTNKYCTSKLVDLEIIKLREGKFKKNNNTERKKRNYSRREKIFKKMTIINNI